MADISKSLPILIDLPMPIETPRLRIQPRFIGEGAIINPVVNRNLEHLKVWMPWAQEIQSLEESETHCRESFTQFISREEIVLSIYRKEDDALIGSTGFHDPNWKLRSFEIGYWIAKEYEGQGFISETVNALTRYAFEVLKARRLEIRCDEKNGRSLSVMTRVGFEVEGTLRNSGFAANGIDLRNTVITSRLDGKGLPPLDVKW